MGGGGGEEEGNMIGKTGVFSNVAAKSRRNQSF